MQVCRFSSGLLSGMRWILVCVHVLLVAPTLRFYHNHSNSFCLIVSVWLSCAMLVLDGLSVSFFFPLYGDSGLQESRGKHDAGWNKSGV